MDYINKQDEEVWDNKQKQKQHSAFQSNTRINAYNDTARNV